MYRATMCDKLWRTRSLLWLRALDVPVLLRVVLDAAIRAEFAHLRRRADALLEPLRSVGIGLVNHLESADVYS